MLRSYLVFVACSALCVACSAFARITGDSKTCAEGIPCLEAGYENGNLIFSWDGDFDKYHIRWSVNDGPEQSRELSGRQQQFMIKNARAGNHYNFKVSGCYSPTLGVGKDRCSGWDTQPYTPGESRRPTPPSPKPLPQGAIGWSANANGGVPNNALPLGKDSNGEPLFGCSAPVGPQGQQTMHPGKVSRTLGGCAVGYGGREYIVPNYQVFVSSLGSSGFVLAQVNGGPLPPKSVAVGTAEGQQLYFCVVKLTDGSQQVGKMLASWRHCHYAYAGGEHRHGGYAVLVMK